MYKFIDSAANNLNPMKEIFKQLALNDELPFQAMLAIASKHRAGVEGKTESVQSLTHKMRALQLMSERIQMDSKTANDGTIYAVATMAVIEVGWLGIMSCKADSRRNGRKMRRLSACTSGGLPP